MRVWIFLTAVTALVVLCVPGDAGAAERVTFTKDVAPILQENCQSCHREGQIAPMALTTYEEVRPWAKGIKQQVGQRKMPPYFAHPDSLPMEGDLNLTEAEIDTILSWVDQGAPRGNPKDLPPPRVFETYEGGWQLKEPDIVLQIPEPFEVSGKSDDLYQCFRIPFKSDVELWLKGVEFQPDNNNVVHHFILFEDRVGNFKKFDDATPEQGCECADMEKVLVGTKMLQMWAPGNVQPLAPEGVANKVLAGTDLILQVHYSNNTGEAQVDQSRFALHMAPPEETIQKQIQGQLVVQPNLNIKAGDPESRHEATYTTKRDITLYDAGVHMHLRGKSMGMWAKRPGDTEETTIVWVPNFDFNWQLTYQFQEPWKAPAGTTFIMRSVHDNSANNPTNPDPTVDVHWGLYSNDEMAFSGFGYTVDSEQLNITPEPLPEFADNPAVVHVRDQDYSQTD